MARGSAPAGRPRGRAGGAQEVLRGRAACPADGLRAARGSRAARAQGPGHGQARGGRHRGRLVARHLRSRQPVPAARQGGQGVRGDHGRRHRRGPGGRRTAALRRRRGLDRHDRRRRHRRRRHRRHRRHRRRRRRHHHQDHAVRLRDRRDLHRQRPHAQDQGHGEARHASQPRLPAAALPRGLGQRRQRGVPGRLHALRRGRGPVQAFQGRVRLPLPGRGLRARVHQRGRRLVPAQGRPDPQGAGSGRPAPQALPGTRASRPARRSDRPPRGASCRPSSPTS